LVELVEALWADALGRDADSPIPPVAWSGRGGDLTDADEQVGVADAIRLTRARVLGDAPARSAAAVATEKKVTAIVQMMSAFELLDDMSDEDVDLLMSYIARVVRSEA
jgi:hypothetical protein